MKTICDAIGSRQCLTFCYSGQVRKVEPHLLGYDSDGDLTLSAWQLSGESGTGFRDFHVSKLSALSIDQTTFPSARKGYSKGDKSIDRIVCAL